MKVAIFRSMNRVMIALIAMVLPVLAYAEELSGLDFDDFRFPTIVQVDHPQLFEDRNAFGFFGYIPRMDVLPDFLEESPVLSRFDTITNPEFDRYIPDVFNAFSFEIARKFEVWLSF